jgi:hypothetical protein
MVNPKGLRLGWRWKNQKTALVRLLVGCPPARAGGHSDPRLGRRQRPLALRPTIFNQPKGGAGRDRDRGRARGDQWRWREKWRLPEGWVTSWELQLWTFAEENAPHESGGSGLGFLVGSGWRQITGSAVLGPTVAVLQNKPTTRGQDHCGHVVDHLEPSSVTHPPRLGALELELGTRLTRELTTRYAAARREKCLGVPPALPPWRPLQLESSRFGRTCRITGAVRICLTSDSRWGVDGRALAVVFLEVRTRTRWGLGTS